MRCCGGFWVAAVLFRFGAECGFSVDKFMLVCD